MAKTIDICLATGNPHKAQEMRDLLADLPGVRLLSLHEVGVLTHEPSETGATFEENAAIKALSYAAQTGMLCLADDSGLEIDALGGRPGVISSHYCTDGREAGMSRPERDGANNARVLRELEGVPDHQRTARFVCVMVLAGPEGVAATSRGVFAGRIGTPPRVPAGEHGFGYDPLFLVAPDYQRTGAELSFDEKNRSSHRGAAARAMKDCLRSMLAP